MLKHQEMLFLMIISFILMTLVFDQAVILLEEVRCLSIRRLKRLMVLWFNG